MPESRLTGNKHDGAGIILPLSLVERAHVIRPLVEKTWDVDGHSIRLTAEWELVYSDGLKTKVTW